MDFELNETQRLIRDTARTFAQQKVAPRARFTLRNALRSKALCTGHANVELVT